MHCIGSVVPVSCTASFSNNTVCAMPCMDASPHPRGPCVRVPVAPLSLSLSDSAYILHGVVCPTVPKLRGCWRVGLAAAVIGTSHARANCRLGGAGSGSTVCVPSVIAARCGISYVDGVACESIVRLNCAGRERRHAALPRRGCFAACWRASARMAAWGSACVSAGVMCLVVFPSYI